MNYRRAMLVLLLLSKLAAHVQAQPDRVMYVTFYQAPVSIAAARAVPTYQGLAVSTDRGQTWENRGWSTSAVSNIAISDRDNSSLFLATDYGVLRGSEHGISLKLVSDQDMPPVLGIACVHGSVWAATSAGLFVSTDSGERWIARHSNLPAPNGSYVTGVLSLANSLLISTADGLFRSTDQGRSWVRSGLDGEEIHRVFTHPTRPEVLAAISQQHGVWISEDGGWNWTQRNEGLRSTAVKTLAFNPDKQDEILVGTRNVGLFRSTNLGKSWDITGGGLSNFNVTALHFDPDDANTVYAGTENGTFISNNQGRSWQSFSVRLGYISAILIR